MTLQRGKHAANDLLSPAFVIDRRDRRPGTHFAAELGQQKKQKPLAADRDPHVDEDLGCSAFGIDLPFLPRD
jgi:hypothetical protein